MLSPLRLLVVGNPAEFHVGAHFYAAARALELPVELCDTRAAFDAPWLARQVAWRARGHRPPRLDAFSALVLTRARAFEATHILATGLAPLTHAALTGLARRGVRALNFLTDDPWNVAHRAPWFLSALPAYQHVFTPRHANENDLRRAGCARVSYLPFAYNPRAHFPADAAELDHDLECDVLFAGGADADRVPYIHALRRAGLEVRLYGGYWERYAETRDAACGNADISILRRAVAHARVCLCLVRRANRDGHVMRSFEVPAMRGCMLTEDTPDHRALFGDEGAAVLYFRTRDEMIDKARWLVGHDAERARLANAAHARIVTGKHTYQDRLVTLLETLEQETARE